ncbi:hypothetical protein N7533_001889 [Penicillium manginii]|jgi:hypothetical protein|uniref:uncharacterized protein n=1 Tax=Penicillium manginii TaxID=203109 RepID=UPI0025495846|nr:uncharacterized protein N7533_001889 [Penicillium manginii]KAJ5763208.1 hypothetical protein N7533_001889 [Penicillium manginii]
MSIAVPVFGLVTIILSQLTARDGDPREFMRNCLDVLREFHWHHYDYDSVLAVRQVLEDTYYNPNPEASNAQRFYESILMSPGIKIYPDMLKFIEETPEDEKAPERSRYPHELSDEFRSQFRALGRLIEGNGPRILVNGAKTHVFPRRVLVPNWVNLTILYATNLLYTLSRLIVMALALASLRSMPDQVCITTWTKNIPAIQ